MLREFSNEDEVKIFHRFRYLKYLQYILLKMIFEMLKSNLAHNEYSRYFFTPHITDRCNDLTVTFYISVRQRAFKLLAENKLTKYNSHFDKFDKLYTSH